MNSRKTPHRGIPMTCCGKIIGLDHVLHKKGVRRPRPQPPTEEEVQVEVEDFIDDVGA